MGLNIWNGHVKSLRNDLLLNKRTSAEVIYDVVKLWVGENGRSATLDKLLNVVEGICEANDAGESLRLHFCLPCKAAYNNPSIDWYNISPAFQNRIHKAFEKFFPNLKFSETLPNLKGPPLINLMTGNQPEPFVHSSSDTLRESLNLARSSDSGDLQLGESGSVPQSASKLIASMLPDESHNMTIGKIKYSTRRSHVLGNGSEGTSGYLGTFDGRVVAVKRLLLDKFILADKEAEALTQLGQNANVIQYFCKETDSQFCYLALELCVATLSDWVEGRYDNPNVDGIKVLKNATKGLDYLHSKGIVHRDVKPANVLLSDTGERDGGVRTLISDFGLSKIIQSGRMSFSVSRVRGTKGWIAPEVLAEDEEGGNRGRKTSAIDVFSMGCVYYYVLSKGKHPFGVERRREINIEDDKYDLSSILVQPKGAAELIKLMISNDPVKRPPFNAVLKHPLFWSNKKILEFFVEASGRFEKKSEKNFPLLKSFEGGRKIVFSDNWMDKICKFVKNSLEVSKRKYRAKYDRASLKGLLRALRNMKNHYESIEQGARDSLGEMPDGFINAA